MAPLVHATCLRCMRYPSYCVHLERALLRSFPLSLARESDSTGGRGGPRAQRRLPWRLMRRLLWRLPRRLRPSLLLRLLRRAIAAPTQDSAMCLGSDVSSSGNRSAAAPTPPSRRTGSSQSHAVSNRRERRRVVTLRTVARMCRLSGRGQSLRKWPGLIRSAHQWEPSLYMTAVWYSCGRASPPLAPSRTLNVIVGDTRKPIEISRRISADASVLSTDFDQDERRIVRLDGTRTQWAARTLRARAIVVRVRR